MSILLFFIILLILVIAHESGHFFAAKWAKMRVEEFGFGFPPKLWSKKFGETEYSFNVLPLGGFVRIFGENDIGSLHPREHSFSYAPRWKQLIVLVAGVVMNVLVAYILFSATLMLGTRTDTDIIPSEKLENVSTQILHVEGNSPAARAGLLAGESIIRIDAQNSAHDTLYGITRSEEVSEFIGSHPDTQIEVYVKGENGNTRSVTITPEYNELLGKKVIGIATAQIGEARLGMLDALYYGIHVTYMYAHEMYEGFKGLFVNLWSGAGKEAVHDLSGPVGIVKVVGNAYTDGFVSLLSITAIISLNLAILNILPFPALDGGRIMFVLIEMILRRPIPKNVQLSLNGIAFVLLLLLMVFVTYQDIMKII